MNFNKLEQLKHFKAHLRGLKGSPHHMMLIPIIKTVEQQIENLKEECKHELRIKSIKDLLTEE